MKEYETQILEIDVDKISERLRALGAKEEEEVLQKRWVYYIDEASWVRLRQVGKISALTYKNKRGTGVSETDEVEVEVKDFEKTSQILSVLNFYKDKHYQENKRKKFILEEIEFTLDTWPKIPTILEIEAKSEEKVKRGLELVGLKGKDIGHEGMMRIYKRYGMDIHAIKELTFENKNKQ